MNPGWGQFFMTQREQFAFEGFEGGERGVRSQCYLPLNQCGSNAFAAISLTLYDPSFFETCSSYPPASNHQYH
jgi:hypothetical protein